ncbi:MAG TPA: rod shape-determining protein MreC [Thermoanaerobaculia bacterium]|nr:rod shape-determining protein MreC [Thermoanaerobaculia bacterium]
MDERRTGYLLTVLLLGQLVLVAIEGARSTRSLTYAEVIGLRILGPVARLVSIAGGGASDLGHKVRLQGQLLDENRRLRLQVEELRLRLLRLGDVEQELARLGDAVSYSAPLLGEIRAVDVVYADHASWLRSLVLYTGPRSAAVNQPVLSPAGLVGRVVVVAGPYAKVQLVTDRAASVGGMILRTRRQGVVRGSGQEGGGLSLDYVPLSADVRPGDSVLTAGIDGVYPRGIPVGTVVAVEAGGQLFHKIRLAPAVDLGALDQVYLLEHAALPQELVKANSHARR